MPDDLKDSGKAAVSRNASDSVHPLVRNYKDAMDAAIEYARPHWEMYARMYQLWRGKRFKALNATTSKIMVNLAHSMVQDRIPKIIESVFSGDEFITVTADNPENEPFAEANQLWLRDCLNDKVKLRSTIHPTMQSMLFGGTAYRSPFVKYDKGRPVLGSRPIEFFHVLPSPDGGRINPFELDVSEACAWVMVIDWWTEDKIKALPAEHRNDEGIAKMFRQRRDQDNYPEDNYRNVFGTIGQFQYGGPAEWRLRLDSVDIGDGRRKRRIVHWFRRDKHVIIGEDAFLLYDGPAYMDSGYFPLVKYNLTNDLDNWFGISFLEMIEDLIKAVVMNINYRTDHVLGVMFPVTWIRQDLQQKYQPRDFLPRPYDVKFFPTAVKRIQDAIYYDRRPEVGNDTFMDEDRMKQFLQKIAGQTETTSSMNDVVGNRTATGVTSILNELAGRPNMEALIVENQGLREEASLLLMLGAQHFTERNGFTEFIRTPGTVGQWTEIDPEDITDNFTVHTQGSRFVAEKNLNFQRLLAMYPFWSQSSVIDQYQLAKQSMDVVPVLPNPSAVLVKPQPEAPPEALAMLGMEGTGGPQGAGVGRPGGAASQQDIRQPTNSMANRNTPEPGTGRDVSAALRI